MNIRTNTNFDIVTGKFIQLLFANELFYGYNIDPYGLFLINF